ncbi:MAG: hypothetical protein ABI594_20190, partial [Ginsengibacter sp.]
MKKVSIALAALLALLISTLPRTHAQTNAQPNVNSMVKQMTLEEKVGQMAQVSIESLGGVQNGNFSFNQDKFKDAVVNYKVGSLLNTPGLLNAAQWNGVIEEIEKAAKETRMKIPVL